MYSPLFYFIYTVHGFSNAFYDVKEGERLDMVFKVNVKGTTGFSSLLLAGNITSAAGPNTSEFYDIYHFKMKQISSGFNMLLLP